MKIFTRAKQLLTKAKADAKALTMSLAVTTAVVLGGVMSNVPANAHVATDLIPAELNTAISNFGADLQLTAVNLAILIIPLGLAIWAVGLGVRKGIGALKGAINKLRVG